MKKLAKWLNVLIAALIVLMNVASVIAQPIADDPPPARDSTVSRKLEAQLAPVTEGATAAPPAQNVPKPPEWDLTPVQLKAANFDMDEKVYYIIQLNDAPLATYKGGLPGLRATAPQATGADKLDAKSLASVAYLTYLADEQAQFRTTIEKTLDRQVHVAFEYRAAYNGLAMRISAREAERIATLPGVKRVTRGIVRYPTTDAGPVWIGAEGVWDGSATGVSSKGEGIIIGVIDTGINMDHPSFADIGGDSYDHTNPLGASNYLGL